MHTFLFVFVTETPLTKTLYIFGQKISNLQLKDAAKICIVIFLAKRYQIDNLMMQPKIVTFSIWVSFGSVNVLLCFGQQGWHVDWDNI